LQCLFESPTVAGLARNIEALQWAAESAGSRYDPQADPNDKQPGEREVVRL